MSGASLYTNLVDEGEDGVFGGEVFGGLSLEKDFHGFGFFEEEALGGHHVGYLGGADAEGEGPKGSVGGGVGVSADDGHAGLCESHFWGDDVYNALVAGSGIEEFYVEIFAIFSEGFDLVLGSCVGVIFSGWIGWDGVVEGGDGFGFVKKGELFFS